MPRIFIRRGILHSSYSPLPGSHIPVWFPVVDPTGAVLPESIAWDGPGIWIESREGVPDGYRALWLGTENATRPLIVHVSDTPTADSDAYDAAYRAAFTGKRRPSITAAMSATVIEARLQGWADRRRVSP